MASPFLFHQLPMNPFNQISCLSVSSSICEDNVHQQRLDFKRPAESSQSEANRPSKQLKTNTFRPCENKNLSNSSFTNPVKHEQETWWSPSSTLFFQSKPFIKPNFVPKIYQGIDNMRFGQSQEHILADRERRDKLSQRFIALSVLVPGLKKTDKASILGDAIEYMKKLEEKVNFLEDQTKRRTMESVVFVKKYELQFDSDDTSSDGSSRPVITETLPRVVARFCNKDVLVNVHCDKAKGTMEKIVFEIEKLQLSVVNSSVMSLGDSALDITITAQKDQEFTLNTKEFVTKLRNALRRFI